AMAVVGLGWILAGLLGGLPYLFSGTMRSPEEHMSYADAVFESVSGFSTTGASVLTELEDPELVPRCILFWRSFTHWLGGMGIIVLFVAVLGQLGAGGKALMRREVPGPLNESVRPRVRETAVFMWIIYVLISLVLNLLLMAEGMSLYDALCHTFGTMATGGFSTRNASIGDFQSPLIESTIIVFMILAGTNFSLYFLMFKRRSSTNGQTRRPDLSPLLKDPEYRVYLSILATATAALTISVFWNGHYDEIWTSFRHSAFQVTAIMTTTGFGTEDFARWSPFPRALLLVLMFIGGCSGSTGGGIKVIRYLLFFKILRLEVEQAYRPNVVRPLRIGDHRVDSGLRHEVLVYFALMLCTFTISWMLLLAIEPDTQWAGDANLSSDKLVDCASAVAATLNNIGPGLGVVGPHANYMGFSPQAKLLLSLLMLLGRLELFAILVLFSGSFWKVQ
ncbi:MAG: potassium transporter TrkG, partial [Planctomycetaceae bacterium]